MSSRFSCAIQLCARAVDADLFSCTSGFAPLSLSRCHRAAVHGPPLSRLSRASSLLLPADCSAPLSLPPIQSSFAVHSLFVLSSDRCGCPLGSTALLRPPRFSARPTAVIGLEGAAHRSRGGVRPRSCASITTSHFTERSPTPPTNHRTTLYGRADTKEATGSLRERNGRGGAGQMGEHDRSGGGSVES